MIERSIDRTRDCLDPWSMTLVKADGSVALCCWGDSVGKLGEGELGAIVRGERAIAARRRLLTGELGHDCLRCPARAWTSPAKLRERLDSFLRDEKELRALRAHARHVEGELAAWTARARTVEAERDALRGHASTVEHERDALRDHARTIESERDSLREHARTLEREREGLTAHAAHLGRELPRWNEHAAALECERNALRDHARTVECERDSLRAHARTIERERDALAAHAANLERAIGVRVWRRLTGPLKRLLLGGRAR